MVFVDFVKTYAGKDMQVHAMNSIN